MADGLPEIRPPACKPHIDAQARGLVTIRFVLELDQAAPILYDPARCGPAETEALLPSRFGRGGALLPSQNGRGGGPPLSLSGRPCPPRGVRRAAPCPPRWPGLAPPKREGRRENGLSTLKKKCIEGPPPGLARPRPASPGLAQAGGRASCLPPTSAY